MMMDQVLAASLVLAAGLSGLALGVAGTTVVHTAPAAFKRLDYRRADSLVRRVVKGVLPWIAGFAGGAAVFALAGSAIGASVILATAAGGLFFVRWILDPLPKKMRMAGATRKVSQQRILALQVMGFMTLLFPAAMVALVIGL